MLNLSLPNALNMSNVSWELKSIGGLLSNDDLICDKELEMCSLFD